MIVICSVCRLKFVVIAICISRHGSDFSFQKKMKCYLVDGSGFLFRAYHAYPVMTNEDGQNLNVVYGFFRILFKLMMEKPDYMLIAWDLPWGTKRHDMDTEYKANRPEAPQDFKQQIPIVHEVVGDLGIANLWVPGYEADDVLATLAKRLEDQHAEVHIISSDKDLKQLLWSNVVLQDPMKDVTHTVQSFEQEYGFEPKYMLDYLSLIGDSADNIKWVPGIWPKTAIWLIQKYHTLENVYAHIGEISESTQRKLVEWRISGEHSKKLVELLHVDAVDSMTIEDLKLDPDIGKYRQVLINQFKFESMSKILDELKKKVQAPTQNSLF